MKTTIYAGTKTLDEYWGKYHHDEIQAKLSIGGEPAVGMKDGSTILFHDGGMITLTCKSDTPPQICKTMFEGFTFLKPQIR